MQLEGPFSLEQLLDDQIVFEVKLQEEDEGSLHTAWLELVNGKNASTGPELMTPFSKSKGASIASSLEDIWDTSLISDADMKPSPGAKKASASVGSDLKLCEILKADGFPESSPMSHRDLFIDTTLTPSQKKPKLSFDIEDSYLANVTQLTPLAFKTEAMPVTSVPPLSNVDEGEEPEPSDVDLFGDVLEDVDFGNGLTQGLHFIQELNSSLKRQEEEGPFRIPAGPSADLSLTRPSELFKHADVTFPTPTTPCLANNVNPRSSLGHSVLGNIHSQDIMELEHKASIPPATAGFALASGRNFNGPSEKSPMAAEKLLKEDNEPSALQPNVKPQAMLFASASGKNLKQPSAKSREKANAILNSVMKELEEELSVVSMPPISSSVGFATAAGKKVKPPSEENLRKAEAMLVKIDSELNKESAASVGFATAAGKKVKPPSEENLRKVEAMLVKIDSDIKKDSVALKGPPRKPVFTSLKKSIPPRTSFGASRSSIASVRSLPRSSLPPGIASSSFVAVKDSLCYFDLEPQSGRIPLSDASRTQSVVAELQLPESIDFLERLGRKGVDMKCINRQWVDNHVELISWKVVSTRRLFGDEIYDAGKSFEQTILDQLLYRYEREINRAQRSCLKKICEGDDSPIGCYVLVVKDIKPGELLLSDGWYSIWTHIDPALQQLVDFGKIRSGMKLKVTNLTLLKPEPTPILDAESCGFKFRIFYNSVKRCKWHEKLGRGKFLSFFRPLNKVRLDGGGIPCIELVIQKAFSPVISVTWEESGEKVDKSKREWEMMQATGNVEQAIGGVSRSLKIVCGDISSGLTSTVKLFNVTDMLIEKCVEGRKIMLFNAKPFPNFDQVELRAYQSPRQCMPAELDEAFVKTSNDIKRFGSLVPGKDYSVLFRILRCVPGENFIWGIIVTNDTRIVVSIELGRFAGSLSKFSTQELIKMKDVEYQRQDTHLGVYAFIMTIHSDWERNLKIDGFALDDSVYNSSINYIDSIVTGRFAQSMGKN